MLAAKLNLSLIACAALCAHSSEECDGNSGSASAASKAQGLLQAMTSTSGESGWVSKETHLSKEDRRIRQCVVDYADRLGAIKNGLGQHLRSHPLKAKSKSERKLIIAAGAGSTATHSLYEALMALNKSAVHWKKSWDNTLAVFESWTSPLVDVLGGDPEEKMPATRPSCHEDLRDFDYTMLPPEVDAIVDSPTFENFLNLFLSFPNASVILTTRNASDWATSRVHYHNQTWAPMQEPCGLSVSNFSLRQISKMFEMNNDFIRCLVPKHQLHEVDIFGSESAREDKGTKLAKFLGLQPRPEASALLRNRADHFKTLIHGTKNSKVNASVYVINLESRADRRECIRSQLSTSPHKVHLLKAADMDSYEDDCHALDWSKANMDIDSAKPILCSNFLVWLDAVNLHSDFIVVFEDDALIEPSVWEEVETLLLGPCKDFDYIQVDTYLAKGTKSPFDSSEELKCGGKSSNMYPLKGSGAQMQIIRRTALKSMIDIVLAAPTLEPVDVLFQKAETIRPRSWQAGLVRQFGKLGTSDKDRQRLAGQCTEDVAMSVHDPKGTQLGH